jgi:hypothetical protein
MAVLLAVLLAGPARGEDADSTGPSLLPDVVSRLSRLSLRYPVEQVYLDEERGLAAARVGEHWIWIEYDGQVTIFGLGPARSRPRRGRSRGSEGPGEVPTS